MPAVPHRSNFQNSTPVWLLDLEWGGETWRVATQPVEVLTSAGRRLSYLGGMAAPTRLRESLGRLETDPGSASATVAAVLPCNVAQRVMQGHSLLAARATIYMGAIAHQTDPYAVPTLNQESHQLWHQLEGVVLQPRWAGKGDDSGYLEFQVKQAPWNEKSKTLLPSSAVLSEENSLDLLGANPVGTTVPLVFGKPGGTSLPGSPCYWIGQGADWSAVTTPWSAAGILPSRATSATLRYRNGTTYVTASKTISRLSMYSGLPVTVIDVYTAAVHLPGRESMPAWVIWDGDGGGSASPYSSGDLRDSAEVAAYCLESAGFAVDVPRWLAIKGRGTFNVDTYVNDPKITAWDWLDGSNILNQMAATIRRGRQGVYPVPYSPDVYATEALAAVTEGRDWIAASRVEMLTEVSDIFNEADVTYGRSAETEGLTSSRLFAVEDALYRPNPSHPMVTSIARYGSSRATLEVETFDAASAESVALRLLALSSLPTFSRAYRAPWEWGWLNVGDAIAITDADASWTGVVAIINEKAWTGAGWAFEVLVDEMLVRDARPY